MNKKSPSVSNVLLSYAGPALYYISIPPLFHAMHRYRWAGALLCWVWSACHIASVLLCSWHDESELRAEAALLMDRVCIMPRGYAAGSTLIRCDEARSILAGGPMPLVVFERAGVRLVMDALAATRREVGAMVRVLGLLGAATAAVLLLAQSASLSMRTWSRHVYEQGATSPMRRAMAEAVVCLDQDTKED